MDARTPPRDPARGDVSESDRPSAAAAAGDVDFATVFATLPGINLVLAADPPHFTMLAASDERLAATLSTREETIGRPLFEFFSDANPDNLQADGVPNLRASLEQVLRTGVTHRMAVQR